MITADRLGLAGLVSFRRGRGERVMGVRTLNSEYLIRRLSPREIELVKVSFNEGVETGKSFRGNELRLDSDGFSLHLSLSQDGEWVFGPSSIILEIIGLNEVFAQ